MYDIPTNKSFPDEGEDFYVDEFGERIETPATAGLYIEDDMPELTPEDESLVADDNTVDELAEPTFNETLKPDDLIDEKIIEED